MSVRQLFDLAGRVALITEGARGLGLQISGALGEMGARLVITARKPGELDAAIAHLAARKIGALGLVCDLSNADAVDPMVEDVMQRRGKIDILVNNAGATWAAPTIEHTLEAWDRIVGLNLTATFLVSQAVGRRAMLPANYGKIVNVASVAGLIGPMPGAIATIGYNSTEGGLINFTRALGAEWAPRGITVNAIAPSVFARPTIEGESEESAEGIEGVPMKRAGGPNDLKGIAVLLASDASAFITGQTIAVDGGYTIV